jgi:hypothetical protein
MDIDLEGLIQDVCRQQMPAALYQRITNKSTLGTAVPPVSAPPQNHWVKWRHYTGCRGLVKNH